MMRNPVFESSMKRRMRSFRAPLLLTLYILFMFAVSLVAIRALGMQSLSLGNLRAGIEAYSMLSILQFALIILVAPALTAGAISGERERQTLDLLLVTRVGALRIVLGKLFSSVCYLALLVVSSLPVMAVLLYFGGVTLGDMLLMTLFLLVTAFAASAIGICASAMIRRTVTATVIAYLVIFAIGLGTLIVPLVTQISALDELQTVARNIRYGSGSVAFISGTSVVTDMNEAIKVPLLFYMNPGLGLLSLLIRQTDLLQRSLGSLIGSGVADGVFLFLEVIEPFALINMVVMAALGVLLTLFAALFVKPGGRRARKGTK